MQSARNIERLVDLITQALFDPDWFCSELLHSPNDDWQSELMNAVADIDRAMFGLPTRFNHDLLPWFSVTSCHGPGKTHVMAKLMHWFGFTHPMPLIPVTAPKEGQVRGNVWPEFRALLRDAEPDLRRMIHVDELSIHWLGDKDWGAKVAAASSPENLAGKHREQLLYLVEEASGVKQTFFPAIQGSATQPGNRIVLIGNPTKLDGEHYASHNDANVRQNYYRIQIGYQDSARVDRAWAERLIRQYGRNSPVVKTRVLGEWPDADAMQLVSLQWIYEARDRDIGDGDGSHPRLRLSVDCADGGEAMTVITAAWLYDSMTHPVWQRAYSFPMATGHTLLADEIERVFADLGGQKQSARADDIVIDMGGGYGDAAAGTLLDRGYNVVLYKGSATSDNPKRWRCRRVQTWISGRDAFRDGLVVLDPNMLGDPDEADWDEFMAQMTSVRWLPSTGQADDIETKRAMRARGVDSPDRADSFMMLYATQTPTIGSGDAAVGVVGHLESMSNDASLAESP